MHRTIHRHIKRHAHKFWTLRKEILTALAALFLIFGSIGLLWISSLKLPDLASFENREVSQSTKIYDNTGKILLYDINQGIKRTLVKSEEISPNVKNATVAIEDSDFYDHHGIKISSVFRAVLANFRSGSYSQGGSTITQQVIKNALLTQEKSIGRKLKELILSLKLERVMNKDEILTLYLNESPYGGNIYGVEEAAKNFFGKRASEVTLAESAYLAALPNAPTYYSPYGRNRDALEKRKNLVLEAMLKKGFIDENQYKSALSEKVAFLPQAEAGIKAPHFVMYVRELLEKQYGSDVMAKNGFKVTTTLDFDLQAKAEEVVNKYALENAEKFNASNAALTAVDPQTGGILVMVGSRDYFDKDIDGNFNVSIAHRQPGSSFKPFVYAKAFSLGYTPDTVVFDLPTEFSTSCNPDGTPINKGDEDKCYMPENYDGLFKGPIKLRNALAESRNIPAIKILYLVGIKNAIDLASDMGIGSLGSANQYGLTLVLGGGEVSLLDMTGAYGVFANEGVKEPVHAIEKIEAEDGTVIYEAKSSPRQVLDANIARMVTDVLSDNEARIPEFGANSPLYFPGYDVADKTGTTNDYRDAWILGYTPNIAVGAWAGNNDNTSMEKKIAGFIVAPMWHAFMEEALAKEPTEHFSKPDYGDQTTLKPILRGIWQGGETYIVDSRSNLPATDSTPAEFKKEMILPGIHSILYWVDKNNPTGPRPILPSIDPQFLLWETPVQKWAASSSPGLLLPPEISSPGTNLPPGPVSPPNQKPQPSLRLTITSPSQTGQYLASDRITTSLNIVSSYPVTQAKYYINGQYVDTLTKSPFALSFVPKDFVLQKYNNIRVVIYNSAGERAEAVGSFVVNY